MVNLKTDPDLRVVTKGPVEYKDGAEGILLKKGGPAKDAGSVVIYNNSKDKFLTFDVYKEFPGKREEIEKAKVNPGKNLRKTAPGGWEALSNLECDRFLGSFKWTDADPQESDPGGLTDAERSAKDFKEWLEDNWWILALFLALGIGGTVAIYYVMTKERAQIVTVQA